MNKVIVDSRLRPWCRILSKLNETQGEINFRLCEVKFGLKFGLRPKFGLRFRL